MGTMSKFPFPSLDIPLLWAWPRLFLCLINRRFFYHSVSAGKPMLVHNRILKMLHRMCSTSLRCPDKIFSTGTIPPPLWSKTTSTSSSPKLAPSSSMQWKESKPEDKTLRRVLSNLQKTLCSIHKRKIHWPSEESFSSKYVYFPF